MTRVHLIAAARPNFMKIAPLYHALTIAGGRELAIVHTGQHYDSNMSDAFFRDLGLPDPHFHLEVGSGSHAQQIGGVMIAYEKVISAERPDWIIVVGDVNSTAACAIVGAKAQIPVVHLEAGLRSRDRRMPEEINRLIADAVSDVFWTPSPDADENLIAEGVARDKIDCVGNIMIDSYVMLRARIESSDARQRLGLEGRGFAVVTLHRPSNVDVRETLSNLVAQLLTCARSIPLVFPIHPRTRQRLIEFDLLKPLQGESAIVLTEPMGYIDFMSLVSASRAAITDSGGIQEETTYLGIPCLTLRENTERPITISEGSNRLVTAGELPQRVRDVLSGDWEVGRRPRLWDGHAATRCVDALARRETMRPVVVT